MFNKEEIRELIENKKEVTITIDGAFGKTRKEKVKVVGMTNHKAILTNGMEIRIA